MRAEEVWWTWSAGEVPEELSLSWAGVLIGCGMLSRFEHQEEQLEQSNT